MDIITHKEFVNRYKGGKILIYVDRNKAGDFVLSKFADKHNKPTHLFWSWLGIFLLVLLPVILFFIFWVYSIASLVLGLVVISGSRKSAEQFVVQNMIDNEDFFEYVLMHQGAKITNDQGEELKSEFLEKMQSK